MDRRFCGARCTRNSRWPWRAAASDCYGTLLRSAALAILDYRCAKPSGNCSGGRGLGAGGDHLAARRAAHCARILFCASGVARSASFAVRGFLGRVFRGGRNFRRVVGARICLVHTGARVGILAGCRCFVAGVWSDPHAESARDVGGVGGRGCDWNVLLPDALSDRKLVVRGWVPCLLGLGTNVSLFRA